MQPTNLKLQKLLHIRVRPPSLASFHIPITENLRKMDVASKKPSVFLPIKTRRWSEPLC